MRRCILIVVIIAFVLIGCAPVTPQAETGSVPVPDVAPANNGYTGMEDVDAIVDALLEQDVEAIVSYVQFIQMACTTATGLGGPPKCEEGEEEGTVVEVFPVVSTHGFYLTPDSVHTLKPDVSALFAVYAVPADTELGIDWPIGQYGLVFRYADLASPALTIFVADGKIVRVSNNFVESPEQALPGSVEILYIADAVDSPQEAY